MLSRTRRAHHSTMRDFTSCFSEHAVKVADASCSGSINSIPAAATLTSTGTLSASNYTAATDHPSIQTATTFLFIAKLSSGNPLLIKLTWSRSHVGTSLSIGFEDKPELLQPLKPTSIKSQLLGKKKGTHSFLASSSTIALHWDFSSATYGQGPEPIDNFYVAVVLDFEFALLLGDQIGEFFKRFSEKLPVAEFSMVYRREQVVGRALHSTTKAQFGHGEKEHEITIRCRGGGLDGKDAELSVLIDKKMVVHVTRLNWNFRGNQTIFIDGSPVDMMWDMHGWWFTGSVGHAVFLFRKRSELESRLWLEEQSSVGFSFLIRAIRSL